MNNERKNRGKVRINFNIIFGLIWELFMMFFTIPFVSGSNQSDDLPIFAIIIVIGFHAIGIFFIVSGLLKFIRDKKTQMYGREMYAVIISVYPSGSYVNGNCIMKADLITIDNADHTERFTEELSLRQHYMMGDIVDVLCYKDDINIIGYSDLNNVPQNVKDLADEYNWRTGSQIHSVFDNMISADDEIVVNGIKYKKK